MSKSKARKLAEFLRNLNDNSKLDTTGFADNRFVTSRTALETDKTSDNTFVTNKAVTEYVDNAIQDFVVDTTDFSLTFDGHMTGTATVTDFGDTTISLAAHSSLGTNDITEHADYPYFTNARARGAISVSGDLAYNSSTGVLSFTERTDAEVRGLLSVTGAGSYNSSTGVITVTGGVTSVNTATGAVVLDTDDVAEGSTNLYYTNARADARIVNAGSANWNTAYGWGDHSTEGYLTSFDITTQTDSKYLRSNTSDTYGNHTLTIQGAVRSTNNANVSGPNFNVSTTNKSTSEYAYRVDRSGSVVGGVRIDGRLIGPDAVIGGATVSAAVIGNWNTAYGWGNHASAGYLTSFDITTQTDSKYLRSNANDTYTGLLSLGNSNTRIQGHDSYPLVQVNSSRAYFGSTSRAKSVIASSDTLHHVRAGTEYEIFTTYNFTDNSTNWNTAYGWGDHASAGYLTSHQSLAAYAPLASPALTGTPTAPTASAGTNTTQIATTAFVGTAVSNLVDSSPSALNTLNELAAALGDDANFSTTVTNSIATKLPLAGGTMTGTLNMGANAITSTGTISSGAITSSGAVTVPSSGQIRFGDANHYVQGGLGALGGDLKIRASDDINLNSRWVRFNDDVGSAGEYGRIAYTGSWINSALNVTGNITKSGNTVWHAGNDGSGSGLDAGLLQSYEWGSLGKTVGANNLNIEAGNGKGLRFWSGDTKYQIVMAAQNTTGYGRQAYEPNSDYNMYFRMQAGTNRGFVFQNGTSNKVGIDASGNIRADGVISSNNKQAMNVAHWGSSGNSTGAIVITLPGTTSNHSMPIIEVVTYEYNSDAHTVYHISGHNWQTGSNWYNNRVTATGANPKEVRLGHNGTAHCIVIGTTSEAWAYGHVTVSLKAHPAFYAASQNMTTGWGISQVTSLSGYSTTVQGVNKVWHSSNDGSGSGLDADTVDSLQASQFLRSDVADIASGRITLQYGVTSDLNSVGGDRGVTAFHTANVGQVSNRPDAGNYATGLEFTYYDASARSQLAAGSGGSNNTAAFYVRSEAWSATNSWTSWYKLWHSGNDGSGSGLDADTLDGYHVSTTRNAANTVPIRDGSGYLNVGWINTTSGNTTSGVNDIYINTGDNYIRKASTSHFISNLGIWTSSNDGSGSGLDADTVDSLQASQFLRSDAADTATGTLTVRDLKLTAGYHLQRSDHHSGHLEGSYNNVAANGSKTNPIYTIGSSYNPNDNSLNNMYGVGFCRANQATFVSLTGASSWGMYVASAGTARVFLDGETGSVTSTGQHYVGANVVWNAGNDGSGSGLDADLLDGQQGSYYYAASNPSGYQTGTGTVAQSHYVSGNAFATTSSPGSVLEYQQASGQTDTKLAPSSDWYNTIRMGHGNPYSYYSSTIAMQMTGTGYGQIKTQSIQNNNAAGWRTQWDSGNDGPGSGLDADSLDGQHGSHYLNAANFTGTAPTGSPFLSDFVHLGNANGSGYSTDDGSWGARLNVSSTVHAKIEVSQQANNMRSHWYAHTGQDSIKFGTSTGHDVELQRASGTKLKLVAGGSLAYEQMIFQSGGIGRADHHRGNLVGSYNNVAANSAKTNPIYVIGTAYQPTATSFSNMYGVGYAHNNIWGTANGRSSGWGFYSVDSGTVHFTTTTARTWSQGEFNRNGNTVWDAGNDGPGSGLDADTLDGYQKPDLNPAHSHYRWTNISASGTQARRFVIMRLYGCPAHWDSNWQDIHLKVWSESYEATNLKYQLTGEYNGGNQNTMFQLLLKDAGGSSEHGRFRLVLGTPVDAGWDHSGQNTYYVDVYAEAAHYMNFSIAADFYSAGFNVNTLPTSGSATSVVYSSPAVSNITTFSEVKEHSYFANHKIWNDGNHGSGSGLDADLLDGYNASISATANTVVVRNGSGNIYGNYILGSYFNASSGNSENPTIGQIWTQNTTDNYLRKSTPSHFASQMQNHFVRTDGSNPAFVKVPANYTGNLNSISNAGVYFTEATGSVSNNPFSTSGSFLQLGDAGGVDVRLQFYAKSSLDRIAFRNQWGNGNWGGWHEFWTTQNDGSGSGLDADTVDSLQASQFLRSDASDSFTGQLTMSTQKALIASNYGHGVYGVYSASKYQHVWSMGTSYNAPANGASTGTVGNLYGLAWTYNPDHGGAGNNAQAKAGLQHQLLLCMNGTTYTALGNGIWTSGNISRNGNTVWDAGNDGSGSGLDADLLDGIQADRIPFGQNATGSTNTQPSQTLKSGFYDVYNNNTPTATWYSYVNIRHNNVSNNHGHQIAGSFYDNNLWNRNINNGSFGAWSKSWSSNNDGSGSGLDADLLDSLQASQFLRSDANDTFSGTYLSMTGDFKYTPTLHFYNTSNTTKRVSFDSDGGIYSTGNITAYSDIRVKENIEVIPNALEKVEQIRGVTFTRNDNTGDTKDKRYAGVIAQEIEQVLPEVVETDEEGIKSVAYGNMVGLLIEAIKQLKEEVEDLKTQLKER
jgi:hypothetical protein